MFVFVSHQTLKYGCVLSIYFPTNCDNCDIKCLKSRLLLSLCCMFCIWMLCRIKITIILFFCHHDSYTLEFILFHLLQKEEFHYAGCPKYTMELKTIKNMKDYYYVSLNWFLQDFATKLYSHWTRELSRCTREVVCNGWFSGREENKDFVRQTQCSCPEFDYVS